MKKSFITAGSGEERVIISFKLHEVIETVKQTHVWKKESHPNHH